MFRELFKPTFAKRVIFFMAGDIVISILTILLSYLLRFNFAIPSNYLHSMVAMMAILIPIKISVFYIKKIYFVAWRFFGLSEYKNLIVSHFITYFIFTLIFLYFKSFFLPFPRSVIFIDLFLSLFFIGFLRILKRLFLENINTRPSKKTVIYGVNSKTIEIIKSVLNGDIEYFPVAIVSRDKKSIGTYIANVCIYNEIELENIIIKHNIQCVIISEILERKKLDKLVERLHQIGVQDIKIAQMFKEDNKPLLKDITLEDLLARKPKDLDKKVIKNFIKDKKILITGAGGSIGSELSRQCLRYGAKELYLLDHSEFNLYSICDELDSLKVKPLLQTVLNKDALEKSISLYRPDIIIHAAAYKHVPLVEENIQEAILNNVIGTKNCIDTAIKYRVKKFVLISTDKAVRPTNVMGATKRVCELYAQNSNSSYTEIVAVRFGNVLGSSGSVIPKFKKQIENGGPITVTHPEITRYFMLIPEACELVLQASAIAKGGEIFILDMGEPVKIVDLAKKMCELSGKKDIKIEFIGLRPGEKLYEELLIDEADKKSIYDSILIAGKTSYDIDKLNHDIEELLKSEDQISKLKEIVPEFNHI